MFKMSLDGANSAGNLSDIPSVNTTPQTTPQKPVDPEAVPYHLRGKKLFPSPKKEAFVEPPRLLPIFTKQQQLASQKKQLQDTEKAQVEAPTKTKQEDKSDMSLYFEDVFLYDLPLSKNYDDKNQEKMLVTKHGNFILPPELPPEIGMPRAKSVSPIPGSKPIPINPRSKSR